MASNWKRVHIYGNDFKKYLQGFIETLRNSGKTIKSSDFSAIEHLHPAGTSGLEKFLEDYQICQNFEGFDVGCGIGGISRYLANRGYTICGVEIIEHFVEFSKEITELVNLSHKATFHYCNIIENNPFQNRFRFSILITVILTIEGNEILKRIYDSLSQGGILYIEDYVLLKETELTAEEEKIVSDFHAMSIRTKPMFIKDLEDAGFEILEFSDFSEKWSEYAWERAERILRLDEESKERLEGEVAIYGVTVPTLLCHHTRYSQDELLQKYPRTCEKIGTECVYLRDKVIGSARIIAIKR